jgi:hypothetical protein
MTLRLAKVILLERPLSGKELLRVFNFFIASLIINIKSCKPAALRKMAEITRFLLITAGLVHLVLLDSCQETAKCYRADFGQLLKGIVKPLGNVQMTLILVG